MAARAGMSSLIAQLRVLCNVGIADFTIAGIPYWSDDQLQAELDALVAVFRSALLDAMPQRVGAAYVYKEFAVPAGIPLWLEEDTSGATAWVVRDSAGVAKVVTTDYTVNYRSGVITFVADTGGASFFLDCRAYDMYQVAATIWRQKAGLESRSVDWSNADHSFKANQRYEHCIEQAERFESKAGIRTTSLYRTDEM
jgi:hypothetical protein